MSAKLRPQDKPKLGAKLRPVPKVKVKTSKILAKAAGVSHDTIRKAGMTLAQSSKSSIEAAAKEKYNKTVGRPKSSMKSTTKSPPGSSAHSPGRL